MPYIPVKDWRLVKAEGLLTEAEFLMIIHRNLLSEAARVTNRRESKRYIRMARKHLRSARRKVRKAKVLHDNVERGLPRGETTN